MARAVGRPKKTDAAGHAPVRKQRKKKDKNAPKRALSAFMFFSNDIRETVKREMPELEFLQISMEIGKRWKQITDEDRRPYDELAAADKRRYQEEKEEYVPDPSFEVRLQCNAAMLQWGFAVVASTEDAHLSLSLSMCLQTTKGSRKKKDPNAPKRALSAYFFFCNEIRSEVREAHPGKKITEIATLLAERWRELPDKKRVKYQKMHEEAKIKYQQQMDVYNHRNDEVEEEDEDEEDDDDE
ncbi:hypothetical protein BBJ28_00020208 [Nothophytophthora sp. Chile5]|nr:hypothetical protein BBJ28_00020208 [Nothophytophthora sp. Chile5]